MSDKKLGDFSGLASNYSKYRPDYSPTVLKTILALVDKPVDQIDFVDAGAGTGIWTRMVSEMGCKSVTAVEPNDDMREHGIEDCKDTNIKWVNGSGENTGLDDETIDLVTMASSFHWVDFDKGISEFNRILKPGGCFAALWNPRLIEKSELLVEIENKLKDLVPGMQRVSSGRSDFTSDLVDRLGATECFGDVIYIEGRHVRRQTPEEYMGVWWSVNDIRAQAGEEKFSEFMSFVENKIEGLESIETIYLTRAWIAKKAVQEVY